MSGHFRSRVYHVSNVRKLFSQLSGQTKTMDSFNKTPVATVNTPTLSRITNVSPSAKYSPRGHATVMTYMASIMELIQNIYFTVSNKDRLTVLSDHKPVTNLIVELFGNVNVVFYLRSFIFLFFNIQLKMSASGCKEITKYEITLHNF